MKTKIVFINKTKNTNWFSSVVNIFKKILEFYLLTFIFFLQFSEIFAASPPSRSTPEVRTNSPVYNGDVLFLIALGGTSFYWTGPNGFSSNLSYNNIYDVDSTFSGVYYCNISDSIIDTTYYLSIIVDVRPKSNLQYIWASFDSNICSEADLVLMATPGYTNYLWFGPPNFGLITSTITNSVTLPNVTLGGYYCVRFGPGYTLGGCVNITVFDCCAEVGEDILLLNNKFSSQLPTLLPGKIAVNGVLQIDNNFDFPNVSDITMLDNAIIGSNPLISPSISMLSINIHGCNKLWHMIDISNMVKTVNFNLISCNIRDSEFGINVTSFSSVSPYYINFNCINNNFLDNYFGLTIAGFGGLDYFNFRLNTFNSSGNLLMTPRSSEHAYNGLTIW